MYYKMDSLRLKWLLLWKDLGSLPYVFYEEATNSDWIYDAYYSYGEGAVRISGIALLEEPNRMGREFHLYMNLLQDYNYRRVIRY